MMLVPSDQIGLRSGSLCQSFPIMTDRGMMLRVRGEGIMELLLCERRARRDGDFSGTGRGRLVFSKLSISLRAELGVRKRGGISLVEGAIHPHTNTRTTLTESLRDL